MANVLFAWEMGEASGHIGCFKPVGDRLLAAGHNLFLALRDLSQARRFFPNPNVMIVQAPSRNARSNHRLVRANTFAELLYNGGYHAADEIAAMFEAWLPIIDGTSPDVIIGDFAPSAIIVAHALGIPYVTMGTGYVIPPSTTPMQPMRPISVRAMQDSRNMEERVTTSINRALQNNELPTISTLGEVYESAAVELLGTYAEFDHYRGVHRRGYYGTWSAPGNAKPKWPANTAKKVFAYLKPFDQLEELFRLLELWDISAIVSADGIPQATKAKLSSPRCTFTTDKIDLNYAAENCDFAITNGNHGTTINMLLHGLPVLACPLHIEQQITGENLKTQGLGTWIDVKQGKGLAEQLGQMALSEEFKIGARSFQRRYAQSTDEQRVERCFNEIEEIFSKDADTTSDEADRLEPLEASATS